MPCSRRILLAIAVALLWAATCSPALGITRWKFTITGTSVTTFDYGPDRKRSCDPDEGGEPTIGAARYGNTLNGTATVGEQRYNSVSGWALYKRTRIDGTLRQSATEVWDEHQPGCPPGTPAVERSCSTGERTSRLNRGRNRLIMNDIPRRYGQRGKVLVGIGHNTGAEGLTFPSLTTHCNSSLFSWLDERIDTNLFASRKVSQRYFRRRRGRLVLEPTTPSTRQPYYPNEWGTVDFRVTLSWRRVGGRMHDHYLCPLRGPCSAPPIR